MSRKTLESLNLEEQRKKLLGLALSRIDYYFHEESRLHIYVQKRGSNFRRYYKTSSCSTCPLQAYESLEAKLDGDIYLCLSRGNPEEFRRLVRKLQRVKGVSAKEVRFAYNPPGLMRAVKRTNWYKDLP